MRILEYMIGSTLWIESEKWWIGEDKGENEATSHKIEVFFGWDWEGWMNVFWI